MYGSQKLLPQNSGRLLLFPGGLWIWMVAAVSWWTLDGSYYFQVDFPVASINQHSCLYSIECQMNTTNEEKPQPQCLKSVKAMKTDAMVWTAFNHIDQHRRVKKHMCDSLRCCDRNLHDNRMQSAKVTKMLLHTPLSNDIT